MPHDERDCSRPVIPEAAKVLARVVRAQNRGPVETGAALSANLAPIAVAALAPMVVVAGPALALIALAGVVAGGVAATRQPED